MENKCSICNSNNISAVIERNVLKQNRSFVDVLIKFVCNKCGADSESVRRIYPRSYSHEQIQEAFSLEIQSILKEK